MAMYVLRLIRRTPDKEYKSPRSLGVRVNGSQLYVVIYLESGNIVNQFSQRGLYSPLYLMGKSLPLSFILLR